jgi:plastocyanin
MRPKLSLLFVFSSLLGACLAPAQSATLSVSVTDANGKPVAGAVVTVTSEGSGNPTPPAEQSRTVDQQDLSFDPQVAVVRRGGQVAFTNSDDTRHHVYSFSDVRKFELVVNPGQKSPPVTFDKVGIATVGCNIHDGMVAHVVVTDAPAALLTSAAGSAAFDTRDAKAVTVVVWHPRLRPGQQGETRKVQLAAEATTAGFQLKLMPERRASGHQRSY